MAKVIINRERCKGCFLCVSVCPKRLIKKGSKLNKRGSNFVEIDPAGVCVGCARCAIICPDCCIEVYK
ncbi:MAG: 4Fe-4S dicluster domain-containing protein [Candidatus Omnitrophica bacterium]|nr:4Fe-4S dicluster domain-containing protein [Candidatus Omnitrophota bacterium]